MTGRSQGRPFPSKVGKASIYAFRRFAPSLFKRVYSDPAETAALLPHYLPEEYVVLMDWDSLEHENKEFVDATLKGRESDILYKVRLKGRPVYIYILFEHQSSSDRWMAFRLIRYCIRIWENFLDRNNKARKLPPILPIVLYQGRWKWRYPTNLLDLIEDGKYFEKYLPSFTFRN